MNEKFDPLHKELDPLEFHALPLRSKMQWVCLEGEFVMDIRYYDFKVNLYKIRDFFVEVFFHHKKDQIEKVELLDSQSTRIKFYADQVKLSF